VILRIDTSKKEYLFLKLKNGNVEIYLEILTFSVKCERIYKLTYQRELSF